MLADYNVGAVIAVRDISAGKKFYGDVLKLPQLGEDESGVRFKSGDSTLFIYESAENAGTDRSTHAGWTVDDLETVVEALKNMGVTFEQYDMPGVTREGDIHFMGTEKAAWFKDPDGTILVIESKVATT